MLSKDRRITLCNFIHEICLFMTSWTRWRHFWEELPLFTKTHNVQRWHSVMYWSSDGILMLHTQPANLLDIPVYHYLQKPPPYLIFWHPLRPLPKFETGAKSELLPVVNVAKCPTHMTWHSHLRLPFTRIYLRFQNLSAWTYLLSAWRTASFRLTSHVLVTTWHLFLLIYTDTKTFVFTPNIIHPEYELVVRIRSPLIAVVASGSTDSLKLYFFFWPTISNLFCLHLFIDFQITKTEKLSMKTSSNLNTNRLLHQLFIHWDHQWWPLMDIFDCEWQVAKLRRPHLEG